MKNDYLSRIVKNTSNLDWEKLYEDLSEMASRSEKLRKSEMSLDDFKNLIESKNYTLLLNRKIIDEGDLVAAMCIAYSWMPTMLEIRETEVPLGAIAAELSQLDAISLYSEKEKDLIANLARITNNSIVGAIKTLHLINSERYPLIDSRVLIAWKKLFGNNQKMQSVESLAASWNIGHKLVNLTNLIEKYFYYRAFIFFWSSNLRGVSSRDIEFRLYLSGDKN